MKDYSHIAAKIKGLNDPFLNGVDPKQIDFGPHYQPQSLDDNTFDVPLQIDGARQTASLDPETLSSLSGLPKEKLTEDEKQLLEHYSKSPDFEFHVTGYHVAAVFKGKDTWVLTGISENGRKTVTIHGVDKHDRDSVMSKAAKLFIPRKPWRELSETDLLTVARMAPGSPESAIYTYINYALPDIDEDVSSNPAYQELCDEIILFVAQNHFPEFDDDAHAFILQKLGNRPLTWAMVRELFALYKEHRFESQRRPSLLFTPTQEPEPTPESIQEDLDNLTDEQVAALRTNTLRLRANSR